MRPTLNCFTFKNFSFALVWVILAFNSQLVWSQELQVEVEAEGAILINADTGNILYQKNAYKKFFPASTTKVATALYALEKLEGRWHENVTAMADDVASIKESETMKQEEDKLPPHWLVMGGTHIGIKRGEILPLKTLFYGMMLASANDASNIIARVACGSVKQFVKELNDYLTTLGCQNTHFVNPHGLYHPRHYTCPYDMAIITKEAFKYPFFKEVVATTSYLRPATNKQTEQRFYHSNRLLKKGPYYYDKAIGVKTGYTSKCGYNFVGAATDQGRTLIAVLMNGNKRGASFTDSIALFEAAFAEEKVERVILKEGLQAFSMKVPSGKGKLITYLPQDLKISYFASEEPKFAAWLEWDNTLQAPIMQDQFVGTIQLVDEKGVALMKAPLLAHKPVKRTFYSQMRLFLSHPLALFKQKKVAFTAVMLGLIVTGGLWMRRRFKESR